MITSDSNSNSIDLTDKTTGESYCKTSHFISRARSAFSFSNDIIILK